MRWPPNTLGVFYECKIISASPPTVEHLPTPELKYRQTQRQQEALDFKDKGLYCCVYHTEFLTTTEEETEEVNASLATAKGIWLQESWSTCKVP